MIISDERINRHGNSQGTRRVYSRLYPVDPPLIVVPALDLIGNPRHQFPTSPQVNDIVTTRLGHGDYQKNYLLRSRQLIQLSLTQNGHDHKSVAPPIGSYLSYALPPDHPEVEDHRMKRKLKPNIQYRLIDSDHPLRQLVGPFIILRCIKMHILGHQIFFVKTKDVIIAHQ